MASDTRVISLLVLLTSFIATALKPSLALSASMQPLWECTPDLPEQSHTARPDDAQPFREGFVDLEINGVLHSRPVYIQYDDQQQLFIAECDFLDLRLARKITPLKTDKAFMVPLSGQRGILAEWDSIRYTLRLTIDTDWFQPTRVNLSATRSATPTPVAPGGYVNYTLQAADSPDATLRSGLILDASIFGSQGVLQSASSVRLNDATAGSNEARHLRLGTTWTMDNPDKRTTLQIGDGTTTALGASPSVRYGGVSFGSNFGLDPRFTPYSTLNFSGAARVPSTVEFLLNDRRLGNAMSMPAGPFTIDRLPTVDGAGEVQVLIRDVLGNDRIVKLPYFKSSKLYGQGVYQYNATVGMKRYDYDQYRGMFGSTLHRYGLSDSVTAEATGSIDSDRTALGVGLASRLFNFWVGELSATSSRGPEGSGNRAEAGLTLQQFRTFSIGLNHRHTSENFRLVGDPTPTESSDYFGTTRTFTQERDLTTARISKNLDRFGTVSASYTSRSTWSTDATQTLTTLGWVKSLAPGIGLSASLTRSTDTITAMLILNFNFENRANLRTSVNSARPVGGGATTTDGYLEYNQPLPTGYGTGYRIGQTRNFASADAGDVSVTASERTFAGAQMRSTVGLHSVDIEHRSSGNAWRLQSSGAIGWLDGHWFGAPPINGGFALVSTKDARDIPVYRENNRVATTNQQGLAVITNMRPYEENHISIRANEVPFEYQISDTRRTLVPGTRGGIVLDFPLTRQHPAIIKLQDPNGKDIAYGAIMTVLETGEQSVVGYRGEAYVNELPQSATLQVVLDDQQCRLRITRPAGPDPQPRIGPLICELRSNSEQMERP